MACHICGTDPGADEPALFTCADCGEPTCATCKSFGVARDAEYCQTCRG